MTQQELEDARMASKMTPQERINVKQALEIVKQAYLANGTGPWYDPKAHAGDKILIAVEAHLKGSTWVVCDTVEKAIQAGYVA